MLTGKDVYEAARPHLAKQGFEDLEWEDFIPDAQDFYVELAEQLNKTHIAPLQGVAELLGWCGRETLEDAVTAINDLNGRILALQELVKDFVTFTARWHWDSWQEESQARKELLARAKQLLREEPKS